MAYTILHIQSSPMGAASASREIGNATLAHIKAQHPEATVITRDLTTAPLPHIGGEAISAWFTPEENRTESQKALVKMSDDAVAEVMQASSIIIETPMWNFGIPSTLKAWVDHISRAGLTFKYTETGPVGLIPAGKKLVIAAARGGVYGENSPMDFQANYLKTVMGFLGVTDTTIIAAEGTSMGEETKAKALATAKEAIEKL